MSDNLSAENRAKNMSAIRSAGTKLEDRVCSELWRRGHRFRRNVAGLYGKPDIAIKKYKTVIFIDSCFWHNCSLHCIMPKSNKKYWENKLLRNKKRDQEVTAYYEEAGWTVIRIWEHDLKKDVFDESIESLSNQLKNIKDGLTARLSLHSDRL